MSLTEERERCTATAKITKCEVGRLGAHGNLTVDVIFEGDGVDQLHLPQYVMNKLFIAGMCDACAVKRLRDCEGTIVKVEYLEGTGVGGKAPEVVAIEPMPFDDGGRRFDIEYWLAWSKAEDDGECEYGPFAYRDDDTAREEVVRRHLD